MHAGCSPTLLNFAVPSFCWIRFPLYLLLCTVFLLNADPSLLTGLCNSLSAGFASVESFALLAFSCFKHVWHRFLGILSLDLSTLSLKLAGSRSATYNLATELLSARGRASTKSGPCCESSSGSSVLLKAHVLQLHNYIDKKFPGCPHFIWDNLSCRTRDANFAAFLTVNHILFVQMSVSV